MNRTGAPSAGVQHACRLSTIVVLKVHEPSTSPLEPAWPRSRSQQAQGERKGAWSLQTRPAHLGGAWSQEDSNPGLSRAIEQAIPLVGADPVQEVGDASALPLWCPRKRSRAECRPW